MALTVRDVAEYLHVDEKTVYRLVQKRELPGFKVAGTWRFRRDEIDSWIDSSREGSAPRARGAARLRALIVEDDAVDRMTIRKAIRETDPLGAVDIVEVTGLEPARAALKEKPFDCVVVDRQLPDGDGVSLLDDDGDALGGAAVVVLTGLEDEEIARAALRRGAQDYLIKGRIEGHTLLRSIRYAIERKRLEEQRRRHEGSFRALIEHSPDAICVLRGTTVIYTNPAFGRLTGLGGEDATSGPRRTEELVHRDDAALLGELVATAGEAGGQQRLAEIRLRGPAGDWLLVEAWARPVVFEDEDAVLLSARDVTRRKQLEEQVVFASRMAALGTLAAGVAHEINNPLAYVTANVDFALADLVELTGELTREPVEVRSFSGRAVSSIAQGVSDALAEARRGAARINYIVRDMKTLARPHDTGDTPVSLRHAVEWSIGVVWNQIRHRARLVKDLRAAPFVRGGEARVAQVAMNLLVNAAHAIPEGNTDKHEIGVLVDQTPDGATAVLEVRDTGCGIAPENLERIFNPFFTTKPVGLGTGLGLSVCHGIVTGLGGRMTVASEVGKGTTFRVFLPTAPPLGPAFTAPPPAVQNPPRHARVLVVDDEELIALALARTLAREHEVDVATGGREALRMIESEAPYDVVLCDLMMPDMSGMELHAQLGARHAGVAEKMIFMTGGAFTPMAQAFLRTVPNLRVEKPIDMRTLMALVRERAR